LAKQDTSSHMHYVAYTTHGLALYRTGLLYGQRNSIMCKSEVLELGFKANKGSEFTIRSSRQCTSPMKNFQIWARNKTCTVAHISILISDLWN